MDGTAPLRIHTRQGQEEMKTVQSQASESAPQGKAAEKAPEKAPGRLPSDAVVVAIVQARMSSTRLPGKSMAVICGRPMLWRVVSRVRRSRLVNQVVVATTNMPADDPIAELCRGEDIPCFRGERRGRPRPLLPGRPGVRCGCGCPRHGGLSTHRSCGDRRNCVSL